MLAHEYGARVTGLTVSRAQYEHARSQKPQGTNPDYLLRDWLVNQLEPASFEAVVAIESTEHIADLQRFFTEAERVLVPGGRLVVCAWLTRDNPVNWERQFLLEPICREGRLRGMGSAHEYEQLARAAGLVPTGFRDVSRQVKRTWAVCTGRVLRGFLSQPAYRQFLLHGRSTHKIFALTVPRIWLAYELGSMRYGILTAVKPGRQSP